MINYYLQLALQNLRRSPWLTALIVLAVGVGIGSSMTVYSLLHAMASDPIPHKSAQLFAPRLDTEGVGRGIGPSLRGPSSEPHIQMSYVDAVALRDSGLARRQAVMYGPTYVVATEGVAPRTRMAPARATDSDFFAMFDVPLLAGTYWGRDEDDAGARVVVLGEELALRLFDSAEVVGRTVTLDGHAFRIIGVTQQWTPRPRFYDLGITNDTASAFAAADELFLPLRAATAMIEAMPKSAFNCMGAKENGGRGARNREQWLTSECRWTQLWVELPTAADVRRYEEHLRRYALEQQRSGRFHWLPETRLRNVREFLIAYEVVPGEYRIATVLAFGFLAVCLVNAVGLMAAGLRGRAAELGLRRTLGASRGALLAQCLTETALLGLLGGLLGLTLAWLGIWVQSRMLPPDLAPLAKVDAVVAALAVGLATAGILVAGLLPAWRASFGRMVPQAQSPRRSTGKVLLAVQVAVTLALVANSLFIASQKLEEIRRPTGAEEASLFMVPVAWPREHADLPSRIEQDLAALRAIPGVRDASTGGVPLAIGNDYFGVSVKASRDGPAVPIGAMRLVDDQTLETWGVRLIAGRWFGREEIGMTGLASARTPAPVRIITRALAERLYPDGQAIGKEIRTEGSDSAGTVIGVVERLRGIHNDDGELTLFVPLMNAQGGFVLYAVRAAAPEALQTAMDESVRRLRDIDPARVVGARPPFGPQDTPPAVPFRMIRDQLLHGDVGIAWLLICTCGLLLLVVALGVVGTTSNWIVQRRTQTGVRRALGARRVDILRHTLTESFLVAGVGVLLGAVLAIAANLWLVRQFGISRIDPLAVLAGASLILFLSQLAAFWPALRASLVPPALASRIT